MPTDNVVVSSMTELLSEINTFLSSVAGADFAVSGSAAGVEYYEEGNLAFSITDNSTSEIGLQHAISTSGASLVGTSGQASTVTFPAAIADAQLWAFANGDAAAATDKYAYFVIEFARDGRYLHLPFGHLTKLHDWVGGAFVGSSQWEGLEDDIDSVDNRLLLDSLVQQSGVNANLATLRAEGLPRQAALSQFLAFINNSSLSFNDGNGNAVEPAYGFVRYGVDPESFAPFEGNPSNADQFVIPIKVAHRFGAEDWPLGTMPDVGIVNIANLNPGDTISLGLDTWQVFPAFRKSVTSGEQRSKNFGIAYKVI